MRFYFTSYILSALLIISFPQCGVTQETKTDTLTIGSKFISEEFKSFISLPKDYNKTNEKYPVIYVLDAEYNFTFTVEAVKILYQNERIPPSIIVGITTNNRERDLTTPVDKAWQRPEIKTSGGADNFLNYIEKELIPTIDKKYRTQPFKAIIGHSLGGLFVLNALISRPGLFQAHIALESSLWWNDGAVGKTMMNYLDTHPTYRGNLFIGRIKIPREAWFPINIAVIDYLEKKRPPGLKYTYLEFDEETHSTMVFPATYMAIRDIFSEFMIKLSEDLSGTEILKYYDRLNINYGYPVTIPEQVYNFLVDISMHAKNYKEAVDYGEMWVKAYSHSYKSFFNLGIAYNEAGNKTKSIFNLEKAAILNPNNTSIGEKLLEVKKK